MVIPHGTTCTWIFPFLLLISVFFLGAEAACAITPTNGAVIVPAGTTDIPAGAYQDCTALYTLTLPTGLLTIGDNAFSGCKNLEIVVLPDTVTSVGTSAFKNNEMLMSVTIGASITSIDPTTFNGCILLWEIKLWPKVFDAAVFTTDNTGSNSLTVYFRSESTDVTNLEGVECDGTSKCGCKPGYGDTGLGTDWFFCAICQPTTVQMYHYSLKWCGDCPAGQGTCGDGASTCIPFPLPCIPTSEPTGSPTYSHSPTLSPTQNPTLHPTMDPTRHPTPVPTPVPTFVPTPVPTAHPTYQPTPMPSPPPTPFPTVEPTHQGTEMPTLPVPSHTPTPAPTEGPTPFPTCDPTKGPTASPTHYPTWAPTAGPTKPPTFYPTFNPTTGRPTFFPTYKPTSSPSFHPSPIPTQKPTTMAPTQEVICGPGLFRDSQHICQDCPADYFAVRGANECEECPVGKTTNGNVGMSECVDKTPVNDGGDGSGEQETASAASTGMSGGAVAGLVIGILIGLCLLFGACGWFYMNHYKGNDPLASSRDDNKDVADEEIGKVPMKNESWGATSDPERWKKAANKTAGAGGKPKTGGYVPRPVAQQQQQQQQQHQQQVSADSDDILQRSANPMHAAAASPMSTKAALPVAPAPPSQKPAPPAAAAPAPAPAPAPAARETPPATKQSSAAGARAAEVSRSAASTNPQAATSTASQSKPGEPLKAHEHQKKAEKEMYRATPLLLAGDQLKAMAAARQARASAGGSASTERASRQAGPRKSAAAAKEATHRDSASGVSEERVREAEKEGPQADVDLGDIYEMSNEPIMSMTSADSITDSDHAHTATNEAVNKRRGTVLLDDIPGAPPVAAATNDRISVHGDVSQMGRDPRRFTVVNDDMIPGDEDRAQSFAAPAASTSAKVSRKPTIGSLGEEDEEEEDED